MTPRRAVKTLRDIAKGLEQKWVARFLNEVSDIIEEQELRIEEQSETIDELSKSLVEMAK